MEQFEMIRAIVKSGKIVPLDPLPPDWTGWEVQVQPIGPPIQKQEGPNGEEIDAEDDNRLQQAIARIRQQAKAMAARERTVP